MKDISKKMLISLSAGGINQELAAHGLGVEHVDELMVQLARTLLTDGRRLAFAGTLGVADQPLTKLLIDAALGWLDEDSASESDVTDPSTWPLVNYSAWPYYKNISESQRADLVGVCSFINVDPAGMTESDLEPLVDGWYGKPKALLHTADALAEMRDRSAQESGIRIVFGGRIRGAKGWMAGILQEVTYSLDHDKPVLILGGFGGCARLLADYLADENADWPVDLSLEACADAQRDALLPDAKKKDLENRLEDARRRLAEYRAQLHTKDRLHGISTSDLRDALKVEKIREAIGISVKVVHQYWEGIRQSDPT